MPTAAAPTALCGGTPALRVVMISLHTSPLAQAGRGDAGGLNVYVNALSRSLQSAGVSVDIVTTSIEDEGDAGPGVPVGDSLSELEDGRRVHTLRVPADWLRGEDGRPDKNRLVEHVDELAVRAEASLSECAEPGQQIVLHSHYWISGLAGLRLAGDGRPLIHTMHTIGEVKRERDAASHEDPRRDAAEAEIAAKADLLTANTQHEVSDLRRLFSVPVSRIGLVKPGVDLAVFHPPAGSGEGDPRAVLEGRPLRLTFAGRLQPHKGPQVAIEALGAFWEMMPGVELELTIAGQQSGTDALDVEGIAEAAGVADIVRTAQPMPHEELAELFRTSDAVLVPSYSESFGLVALEAMACGTPVLAHDVGGLSELVLHRRTGRLIGSLDPQEWAGQMRWLVLHRRAWSRYSTTAAVAAQSYSWASTASAALSLYRSLSPARVG